MQLSRTEAKDVADILGRGNALPETHLLLLWLNQVPKP